MMPTKAFYCLTWTLSILSWMIGVRGVVIEGNGILARAAPTPGQLVTGGTATFFFQNGLAGACGVVNRDSNLIAAVSAGIFSNSLCGVQVQITNTQNGESVTATIADECPTCNDQSLDLSVGSFDAIATQNQGEVPIQWTLL